MTIKLVVEINLSTPSVAGSKKAVLDIFKVAAHAAMGYPASDLREPAETLAGDFKRLNAHAFVDEPRDPEHMVFNLRVVEGEMTNDFDPGRLCEVDEVEYRGAAE